jgi:hypothetical protein
VELKSATNVRPRGEGENDTWNVCDVTMPVIPGGIMQAYFYSCSECGDTVWSSYLYYGEPLKPSCPEGWTNVSIGWTQYYFCSKHEVKQLTFVDGKEKR